MREELDVGGWGVGRVEGEYAGGGTEGEDSGVVVLCHGGCGTEVGAMLCDYLASGGVVVFEVAGVALRCMAQWSASSEAGYEVQPLHQSKILTAVASR